MTAQRGAAFLCGAGPAAGIGKLGTLARHPTRTPPGLQDLPGQRPADQRASGRVLRLSAGHGNGSSGTQRVRQDDPPQHGGGQDFPRPERFWWTVTPPPRSTTLPNRPAPQKSGFVFQFFQLLPILTVLENVELPLLLAGARETAGPRLNAWNGRSRGAGCGTSPPVIGRPAAARGHCPRPVHRPSILVADQPTGNLDTVSGDAVLKLIRQSAEEFGATVVMATHSAEAAAIADTRVRLRDGRINRSRVTRARETLRRSHPAPAAPRPAAYRAYHLCGGARGRGGDRHRPGRGCRGGLVPVLVANGGGQGGSRDHRQWRAGREPRRQARHPPDQRPVLPDAGGWQRVRRGPLAVCHRHQPAGPREVEAAAYPDRVSGLDAAGQDRRPHRYRHCRSAAGVPRYGHLDRIDIFIDPKQDFEAAEGQIQAMLPPGYRWKSPGRAAKRTSACCARSAGICGC